MHKTDFPAFSGMLDDIWGLKGQALTAGQRAMFFRALSQYGLDAVRAGLDAHVRDPKRGQFLPMPADVIAQIEGMVGQDGRPGAEEAWALALKSTDEADTVVWTVEMAEAWGIARSVFDLGDEVGARMAFKETYLRLVDVSRRQRKPIEWVVSLGFDQARRDPVIAEAVALGRLDANDYPALPPPSDFLMLTTTAVAGPSADHRKTLRDLIARLKEPREPAIGEDGRAKEETKRLQAETARRVAEHQADESRGAA